MKQTSTNSRGTYNKSFSLLLTIFGLLISQLIFAHNVTSYTTGCGTGPKYSITPVVNSVNSGSNYAWQYKSSDGSWVCITNGNNTIKSYVFVVSGATSTATTTPSPIVFTNPNTILNGLVVRCVISDGSGVNPCNLPTNNTYNSGSNSVNLMIDLSNSSCNVTTVMQLGNRVWNDVDNDGYNDGESNGEYGIANITLNLYKDANKDDVPDGTPIATTKTDNDGYYLFTNLAPGYYVVGAVLPAGYQSSDVNGGDPDNNINLDDNGQVLAGNEIRGLNITLAIGTEPDGDGNTNISYDFGMLPDCDCTTSTGNLLVNGSFENGNTGWSATGGTLTTGTGYIACGAKNGFNNWSSGTSIVYQDVAVSPGALITFKGFAGTHTPGIGCTPKLSLVFYKGSTLLTQSDVIITQDVDKNHSQLAQYTIAATAPSGTTIVRVQSSITCNVLKMDAFCLTTSCTTPATPTATVTQPTCTISTGSIALSNLPSGNWTINGTNESNPFTLSGSGTTYTAANITPGTYIYSVTNSGGCTSATVTTVVKAQPVTPVAPTATITQSICGTSSTGSITLTGLPTATTGWAVTKTLGTASITINGTGSSYTFTGLTTGTYSFTVMDKSTNSGCTSPATSITLSSQNATAVLGGYVWVDANKNGKQDDGNTALGGVPVSLYKDADANGVPDVSTAIATTTSNATTGRYSFPNLCPGNYVVLFGLPNGYIRTLQLNTVSGDQFDSDASPSNGYTNTISLTPGESSTNNDAGYYSATILPVTFGAITAKAHNCEVYIDFEILTQKNLKQFVIEYSKNGGINWNAIASIDAKQSSASSGKYSFTHTQPAAGMNLYRIKGVDADGKATYSEIVSTYSTCSGKGSIVAYPNPAHGVLTVVLPSDLQDAQLQLFNGVGQLIQSEAKTTGLVRSVETDKLKAGVYIMKVIQNGNVVSTQKVIKE